MTSRTPVEISAAIMAKLAVTLPGLSMNIGSPERKFVDIVAEAISEVQVDNYLVSNQLDIDTKSGADLEEFVSIFGFGRLQGTYSTGTIKLSLTIPATQVIVLPTGTQFFKSAEGLVPTLFFSSTSPIVINIGDAIAYVPVRSNIVGTVGNVVSGTVKGIVASQAISTATNDSPFIGGTDDESDEQLRTRFKKTFLRNITGTSDFYAGIALQIKNVSRVKILGPVNEFYTQIQTTSPSEEIVLPATNCKYVWPKGTAVVSDKGLATELWMEQGIDYTMLSEGETSAPKIKTFTNAYNRFLDINYEYCSTHSRNDPARGIANKVDVFVDGVNSVKVQEKLIINSVTLNNVAGSTYHIDNFAPTIPGSVTISTSSKFQRLASTPIVTPPQTIVAGGTTYTLGVNYAAVYDTTVNRGSERELSGIVWITTPPANGLETNLLTYWYNQTPEALNAIFKRSKQITTDVMVHSATYKYYSFKFVIQYDQGVAPSQVDPNIVTALNAFLGTLTFGDWIQFSDLIEVVHGVAGVDNCRMADVNPANEIIGGVATFPSITKDFQLDDNALPVLWVPQLEGAPDYPSMFIRKSYNNFN